MLTLGKLFRFGSAQPEIPPPATKEPPLETEAETLLPSLENRKA
jgi:hypothetical protein